jgi:serine protease inhibitor
MLTMPRFRLQGASVSREALWALGVRSIDNPTLVEALGTNTSLAAIDASTELVVDERGLSVRDSAAIEVVVRGDRHDVRLTRPFLVFVFDRSTDALLLIGRVVTPDFEGAPVEPDTRAVTTAP